MLMTIISMFGGGLMRMLPELLGLLNKRTDNSHELAMMDKQIELQKSKAADDRETIQVQGNIDQTLAMLDAQKATLQSQMQKLGIWWVDALNFLVRPLTTYYFLGFYGLVKIAMIVVALRAADPWVAIIKCWSQDDAAILSGILAFWFVGRVFDKKQ